MPGSSIHSTRPRPSAGAASASRSAAVSSARSAARSAWRSRRRDRRAVRGRAAADRRCRTRAGRAALRGSRRRARGRVLVVDDEVLFATALRACSRIEHDVAVVDNGRAALDRIESRRAVRRDPLRSAMPEMTGAELHAVLTQLAPDQANRVIFLSGGRDSPGVAGSSWHVSPLLRETLRRRPGYATRSANRSRRPLKIASRSGVGGISPRSRSLSMTRYPPPPGRLPPRRPSRVSWWSMTTTSSSARLPASCAMRAHRVELVDRRQRDRRAARSSAPRSPTSW